MSRASAFLPLLVGLSLGGPAVSAPVLWETTPRGLSTSSSIATPEAAQVLDELTAPLSAEQMGLTDGVDFDTQFDAEFESLRQQRLESEESAEPDRAPADQILDPGAEGPSLPGATN